MNVSEPDANIYGVVQTNNQWVNNERYELFTGEIAIVGLNTGLRTWLHKHLNQSHFESNWIYLKVLPQTCRAEVNMLSAEQIPATDQM